MKEFSVWHKNRFRFGAAEVIPEADENILAAHKFLCRIISLEDSEYAFLLLKCIYYFLFFSFPDKYGRPSVRFEELRRAKGRVNSPRNPYPVFLKAAKLGIKTSLCGKNGNKVKKLSEASYVTLVFSDSRILKGLISFEKGAEEKFSLSERKLYRKMFPYFISADFSFLYEDNIFIKKHYLSGYSSELTELCENLNKILYGVSVLFDVKTEYLKSLVIRRSAIKKGSETELFSLEFGERKSCFVFSSFLNKNTVFRLLKTINEYSPAFIQRFLHDKNCECNDCCFSNNKVFYKNKIYSVPFKSMNFVFEIYNNNDFEDMLRIIGLVLSELPSYSDFLNGVSSYKSSEEGI